MIAAHYVVSIVLCDLSSTELQQFAGVSSGVGIRSLADRVQGYSWEILPLQVR